MKIKSLYNTAILIIIIMITGCSEEWLNETPPHLIATESLYTSLAGFEAGLNGLYTLVRQEREGSDASNTFAIGGSNQVRYELMATGTDNMCANRLDRFSITATQWGDLNSPHNVHLEAHFIWLYRVVNAANTIINSAEHKTDVDWTGPGGTPEEHKNRVIGEARAMRAWAYRHLTYMWGDVPLSLEESLGSNIKTDWTRAPVADVRKQIIADLLFAEKSIPISPTVRGKITKGASQHYLAEIYLAINKPDSALFWADKAINTPQYQLITKRYGVASNQQGTAFSDMFLEGNANREEGNTEALWVWQFGYMPGGGRNIMRRWHGSEYGEIVVNGVKPFQLTVGRGGRPQGRFSFTKFAMDLYEPEDDRGSHHIIRKFFILQNATQNSAGGSVSVPNDRLPPGYAFGDTIWMDWSHDIMLNPNFVPYRRWPYSRKYDHANPANVSSTESNKDQPYLRLAETYLIKAEAEMKLNQHQNAANTINALRRRANVAEITADDVNIDFILDERSRELIMEEHRRYTLLRTGKWLERTRLHNKNGGQNISDRDTLFPIPQIVIDANLTSPMPQNPGWDGF
jgi:starch-binding outer membrane protein, SusD/RagB family